MATQDELQIAALKKEVYKLRAELNFLYKHFGVTFVAEEPSPNDDPEVVNFLKAGKVLNAINAYRNKNKVDMDTAKAAIEEMRARLGI